MRAAVLAAVLASARAVALSTMAGLAGACSAPSAPGPTAPTGGPPDAATSAGGDAGSSDDDPSSPARQEERLAAIQFAMNQLDEGAQLCWAAAAAVEGYQLAGELAFTIEIAAAPSSSAAVTLARDNTRTPRLLECMRQLLASYRWAPPLAGQTIQLPFKFRAPSGQSVVDRTFVPAVTQGPLSVAVLLDERNTGNAAASMLELTLAAGATTGLRRAERTEAWIFLGEGTLRDGNRVDRAVRAGDMLLIPKDSVRQLTAAPSAPLRAVLLVTPGGEEGVARAGALPTPLVAEASLGKKKWPAVLVAATAAATFTRPGGTVALSLDPKATGVADVSASIITLDAGAAVPPHRHAAETELLYILEGAGTMTVGGAQVAVTATSAVQVPPGVEHSFTATAPLRAIQLYTPGGPEQRFKAPPTK